MRIGLFTSVLDSPPLDDIVQDARQAEAEGFATYSMANIFGHDAIGALTVAGTQTERIRLLPAVVPIQPRHPLAMAQQALTAQAAAGGRFTLGLGFSHQMLIEGMFGLGYDHPAARVREYLSALVPILKGERAQFAGEHYTARGGINVGDAVPVSCVIAALAPAMLRVAGELTDGTVLWMTAAKAIEQHVAPRLRSAASGAGRPEPEVICALPVSLVSDATAARAKASELFAMYGQLPSYRSMLDHEGAAGPGDVALVGDEATLDGALRRLEEAGATEFNACIFEAEDGSAQRTRDYLASLARDRAG